MSGRSLFGQQGGVDASCTPRRGPGRASRHAGGPGLDLARERRRSAAVRLRSRAPVCRWAASRHRCRRRPRRRRSRSRRRDDHVRRLGAGLRQVGHDHDRRRLCRHAHAPWVDRGDEECCRRRRRPGRDDRRERRRLPGSVRPPRCSYRLQPERLPRPVDVPTVARARARGRSGARGGRGSVPCGGRGSGACRLRSRDGVGPRFGRDARAGARRPGRRSRSGTRSRPGARSRDSRPGAGRDGPSARAHRRRV